MEAGVMSASSPGACMSLESTSGSSWLDLHLCPLAIPSVMWCPIPFYFLEDSWVSTSSESLDKFAHTTHTIYSTFVHTHHTCTSSHMQTLAHTSAIHMHAPHTTCKPKILSSTYTSSHNFCNCSFVFSWQLGYWRNLSSGLRYTHTWL